MRSGTLLHKVHLAPASRYSEDIDLVVVGTRLEEHIRRAVRRVLADVLGAPKTSVWDILKLALRSGRGERIVAPAARDGKSHQYRRDSKDKRNGADSSCLCLVPIIHSLRPAKSG